MAEVNAYEAARLERMRRNAELMAQIKIPSLIAPSAKSKSTSKPKARSHTSDRDSEGPPGKKQRRSTLHESSAPARSSARIASAPKKTYYAENDADNVSGKSTATPQRQGRTTSSRRSGSTRVKSEVDDAARSSPDPLTSSPPPSSLIPQPSVAEIQANWTNWTPTAPPPRRDDQTKTFHFADQPTFTPNKSPDEMLKLGVFGGSYYRPLRSRKLGITVQDDWKELPPEWLENLNVEKYVISPTYDPEVNFFGVACGQSIEDWEASGWIAHEFDVRGWFQWYVRFFQGRRCEDDERQVSRWRKCVGPTGRWRRALLKKYLMRGVKTVWDMGDEDFEDDEKEKISPVVHQTCLHWAFEVRQEHLDEMFQGGGA